MIVRWGHVFLVVGFILYSILQTADFWAKELDLVGSFISFESETLTKNTTNMGYQIETILTDGRKVRAVYGSKNEALLTKLIEYLELYTYTFDECDDLLRGYFDVNSGQISTRLLLENIVEGDTYKDYSHLMLDTVQEKMAKSVLGAVYGYLERDICLFYGKVINRNEDGWPMLPSYLETFENRNRSFFKRPYSLDFPHTFCVLYEELDKYYDSYRAKLTEKYPDDEDILKDLAFIFEKAKVEKMDIYFCNY